jgi:hypothetical protein
MARGFYILSTIAYSAMATNPKLPNGRCVEADKLPDRHRIKLPNSVNGESRRRSRMARLVRQAGGSHGP